VWADRVGRIFSITDTKILLQKNLCSKHFLGTDFTIAETIDLKRLAVPCVSE
jgi:hypothetical protein